MDKKGHGLVHSEALALWGETGNNYAKSIAVNANGDIFVAGIDTSDCAEVGVDWVAALMKTDASGENVLWASEMASEDCMCQQSM